MNIESRLGVVASLHYLILVAYPESPGYPKNKMWERLAAAKLNDRG